MECDLQRLQAASAFGHYLIYLFNMIPQVWNNTIHLLDKPELFNDQLVKITKCIHIISQLL